jgi:hypothetical protein
VADYGVFIGFGFPARNREEGATKVFGELMTYLGGQAGQGNVESFEPVFLQPHGGELGGFVLVRGDRTKLDQMVASPEFQRLSLRGSTAVDHFGVVNCTCGNEIQHQMAQFLPDTADVR